MEMSLQELPVETTAPPQFARPAFFTGARLPSGPAFFAMLAISGLLWGCIALGVIGLRAWL
jgi:hypothetical protein